MRTCVLCLAIVCAPALPCAAQEGGAPVVATVSDIETRFDRIDAQLSGPQHASLHATPVSLEYEHDLLCPHCCACQAECGAGGGAYPNTKITGFFQLDAGFYSQDAVNRLVLGDIEDGVGFRRARLAATGEVAEDVSYIVEFDIAQAQARFVDVWMQFAATPLGKVRIGRYRQPFGMSELTSVRDLAFLERPMTFALAPFRQTGVMLFDTSADERTTWAVSGYRFLSDNFGNVYADTGGYGAAARLTRLLVDEGDERIVHVGVDYSYNDPGRGIVQFVSTNEFFVGQNPNLGPNGLSVLPIIATPPFVNTGEILADDVNMFNAEAAVSLGRFAIQSEARWAVVDATSGQRHSFPGAYAQIRYVLTGETIAYNRDAGVFGRIKPCAPVDFYCGQWGAWEIAARWSYLNLNDAGLPGPGRRLTDTTIGLNWYVNDHTKFQCHWIHSQLADPTFGDSRADTLALRGQIDF